MMLTVTFLVKSQENKLNIKVVYITAIRFLTIGLGVGQPSSSSHWLEAEQYVPDVISSRRVIDFML